MQTNEEYINKINNLAKRIIDYLNKTDPVPVDKIGLFRGNRVSNVKYIKLQKNRNTKSFKNWYTLYKIASYGGEYWIIDGRLIGADGDIGDYNHEAVVILSILNSHDIEDLDEFSKLSLKEIKKRGFAKEEIEVLEGKVDARDYGMKVLGWIRVKGNAASLWGINSSKLKNLADGYWEIFNEESETNTYEIEDFESRNYFSGVPFEVLSNGDVSELLRFQHRYA